MLHIFTNRLNNLNIRYMITGSIAGIVYGEPRMTHDIDLVVELEYENAERFAEAFPIETFYCPPIEVIKVEITGDSSLAEFTGPQRKETISVVSVPRAKRARGKR